MRDDVFKVFFKPKEEAGAPPVLKAITVRLPQVTYDYLEAMAEHADMSRNAMAVQLIQWGENFALGQLPDEIRDEIGEQVEGPEYHLTKDQ